MRHLRQYMQLFNSQYSKAEKKFDAFNTMLPDIYETVGFKPVSKIAWDDTQAPDGWSKEKFAKYNNGEPDLVFFVYDPNYFGGVNIDDLPVSSM